MIIINKSIRIIDYENEQVISRVTPELFNVYVKDLILHINTNNSVREYKSRSNATEVIGSILQILQSQEQEFVNERVNVIANRLLRKEIETQTQMRRMNVDVRKGSIVI